MCKNRIGDYDINGVKETLNLIQKRWPQYYTDALEYFHAPYAQFYNCFIMKKEYFNQMCTFVFDVLFELEKNWILNIIMNLIIVCQDLWENI